MPAGLTVGIVRPKMFRQAEAGPVGDVLMGRGTGRKEDGDAEGHSRLITEYLGKT